jgi:hypothetical protein
MDKKTLVAYIRQAQSQEFQNMAINQAADRILAALAEEAAQKPTPLCPTCKGPIFSTERRPNGDSTCLNGHKHKTAEFYAPKPTAHASLEEELRAWCNNDVCSCRYDIERILDGNLLTPTESIAEEPKSRSVIRYSAKVKGEERVVTGYFFKTPLTSENWEADHFGNGVVRFCIATEDGVAYEIDEETLTHEVTEPEEWLCPDCGKKSGVYSEEEAAKLARSSAPIAEEPLAMDKRTALAIVEYETTRARAVLDGMESENRARERQGNAHAWPESCFCEVTEELEQKTKAARQYLESLPNKETI